MLNLRHVYLVDDDPVLTTGLLEADADFSTGFSTHVGFAERVVTDFGASLDLGSVHEYGESHQ